MSIGSLDSNLPVDNEPVVKSSGLTKVLGWTTLALSIILASGIIAASCHVPAFSTAFSDNVLRATFGAGIGTFIGYTVSYMRDRKNAGVDYDVVGGGGIW